PGDGVVLDDLNPIACSLSLDAWQSLGQALGAFSTKECQHDFHHGGYHATPASKALSTTGSHSARRRLAGGCHGASSPGAGPPCAPARHPSARARLGETPDFNGRRRPHADAAPLPAFDVPPDEPRQLPREAVGTSHLAQFLTLLTELGPRKPLSH